MNRPETCGHRVVYIVTKLGMKVSELGMGDIIDVELLGMILNPEGRLKCDFVLTSPDFWQN